MKKEAKEGQRNAEKKVMTYININKRITELAKMGLLEEIKPDMHTVNIHGRKDYKVTVKFAERFLDMAASMIKSVDEYLRYGKLDPLSLTNTDSIIQLKRRMFELDTRLKIMERAIIAQSPPRLPPGAKLLKQKEEIDSKTGRRTRTSELVVPNINTEFEEQHKTVVSQKKKH
jgi:hypothetical protein